MGLSVSRRWLVPRVLLLVCVALGLTAMHTIGHAGMSGSMVRQSAHAPLSMSVLPGDTPPADTVTSPEGGLAQTQADAPQSRLASLWVGAPRPASVAGDMWNICLAVLGATVLLLTLGRRRQAAAVRWASSPWLSGALPATGATAQRLALRVADLSVVRR